MGMENLNHDEYTHSLNHRSHFNVSARSSDGCGNLSGLTFQDGSESGVIILALHVTMGRPFELLGPPWMQVNLPPSYLFGSSGSRITFLWLRGRLSRVHNYTESGSRLWDSI